MSYYIDIEKNFGRFFLKVKLSGEDEIIALLGASGSGKTLTLKCIAGIEKPDKGKIVIDGITFFDSDKNINLEPGKRKVGFLFQNYALFPNMTIKENLSCVISKEDRDKKNELVAKISQDYEIGDLLDDYPDSLSGGQKQRVALARIMLTSPNILLLDEPFSALDSHLKFKIEQDLHERINKFGKTVILVSHDRDEVYRLSDTTALVDNGNVLEFGKTKDVFDKPKQLKTALLTGCKNVSEIIKIDENHVKATAWGMVFECDKYEGITHVGVRMHDISIDEKGTLCEVVSQTENPFSFVIGLRKKDDDADEIFYMEISKEEWTKNSADNIRINVEKALFLKE